MKHYIDKDALVAEIKRLKQKARELYGCSQFDTAYNNVLKSIDTLEVKEVNLEKAALKAKINQMIREIDQMGTYLSPKGVLVNLLCHIDTPELGT